jgi:hypothetical protein
MKNFNEISKANESIRTTDIKGKEYAEVNQRIKAFRMVYPQGAIVTEFISLENGVAVIKASVFDEEQKILGTGLAYEKEGSTFINKTSYIENCETSAVGRALGMCGFGIDTSVCSAEELNNALLNQRNKDLEKAELSSIVYATEEQKVKLDKLYKGQDDLYQKLLEHEGVTNAVQLTAKRAQKLIDNIEQAKKKAAESK